MASVMPFGCIVDFAPGKSGLVHVSELDLGRTADPAAIWKAGDKIDVKILEYEKASGRCKLSRYLGFRPIIIWSRAMHVSYEPWSRAQNLSSQGHEPWSQAQSSSSQGHGLWSQVCNP